MGQLVGKWLVQKGTEKVRASTLETYGYQVSAVQKVLGQLALEELNSDSIMAYVSNRLQVGRSPETVGNELAILRMGLRVAFKRGWWRGDSDELFDGVDLEDVPEKRWLRKHEVRALLDAVDVDQQGVVQDPRFGIAVRLALLAGLRVSEATTREWSDLDWDGRLLFVGPKQVGDWTWRTKSGKPRRVPLSSELWTSLKRWHMQLGQPKTGWIVPTLDGERRHAVGWLNRKLHEVCLGPKPENGEMRVPIIDPPVTYHGLRHSFASLALAAGVPLEEISEVLGHSSIEFTRKQYAHIDARRLVDGMDRMGSYLGLEKSVTGTVTRNRHEVPVMRKSL